MKTPIHDVAFPKNTKIEIKFSGYLLSLTSFDYLMARFHLLIVCICLVILKINQILDRLIIQLVWYILKQLFTSVSVKVVNNS